ncbi:hypothetical protein BV903_011370 [Lysobacter enzymogenes]|nr:hypothetical protein [Lysobacter enzymogenes]UZW62851.1 hypothetical protein BV903_011370 [Lysobacter enzymogenes]
MLLTVSGYNPFGPATGWTYGNGRVFARTFDLNYAVQSLRDSAVGGLDLGFARNELLQVTALHNAAFAMPAKLKFDYDTLSRLTKFRDGDTNTVLEAYDYDATGNRTLFTDNGELRPTLTRPAAIASPPWAAWPAAMTRPATPPRWAGRPRSSSTVPMDGSRR